MKFIVLAIEFIFSAGLLINAALFIPQIIKLLQTKTAKGLSVTMFVGFCFIQTTIILHGYIKGDYLLAGGYLLSLLTCGTATILIFVYRRREKSGEK